MHLYLSYFQHLTNISRCLAPEKLYNILRLLLSFFTSLSGHEKTGHHVPVSVSVEIASYCNLHCPECPVGSGNSRMTERKNFDFEVYKNLVNELKSSLCHIILYFQGEPFLNHRLTEFISYAHAKKIYTSTSTNGQFLNKNNAKELVLSGLDKLIISIDGTTQEIYEKYRVGGSLQKAISGVQELITWKEKLKSATPLVEIQFLVLKNNEHQLHAMRKLAKELKADKLTFKSAQLGEFDNGHPQIPSISKYSRYAKSKKGTYNLKGRMPNHCWRAWSGAVITADGEVLPCCFDKSSVFSFGNINAASFADCWHSEKAINFRKALLTDRKQFDMCRNCTSRF